MLVIEKHKNIIKIKLKFSGILNVFILFYFNKNSLENKKFY